MQVHHGERRGRTGRKARQLLEAVARAASKDLSAKRPRRQARLGSDDLAGIEDMSWIENPFELAKDRKKPGVLPGDPGCPGQAGAMLSTDRSSQVQHLRVDLVGDGQQAGHLSGLAQVEKQPGVDLAGQGMDEERRRGLVAPEDRLHAVQVNRELVGRHPHVFDEWNGLGRSAQGMEAGQSRFTQTPETLDVVVGHGHQSVQRQTFHTEKTIGEVGGQGTSLGGGVGLEFDQKDGCGGRRDQGGRLGMTAAHQHEQAPLDQFAGCRIAGPDQRHGLQSGIEPIESQQDHGSASRQGNGPQSGLGGNGQGSLGPDQQAGQVQIVGTEDIVEEIAAAVERGARLTGTKDLGIVVEQSGHGRHDVFQAARLGLSAGPTGMMAGRHHIPRVQDDAETEHVFPGVAVTDQPGSGGIGRHHASDGTLCSPGRVRGEASAVAGQHPIEVAVDDAGLHAHRIAAHFEDRLEMLTEIDDQARAQGLAGHAAAATAWHQGKVILPRVADYRLHVLLVERHHDAHGLDLENAGIGAVQHAREVIEEKLPLDESLEVFTDPLILRPVHGIALLARSSPGRRHVDAT